MFHVYTFGTGSKQFLIMTPEQADLMNRFTDAFFEAQDRFKKTYGRRWEPSDAISFDSDLFSREDMRAYDELVMKNLNRQHAIRNKLFTILRVNVREEELDDYLVKRF